MSTYLYKGRELPSVTTILNATQDEGRKGELELWYAVKKNAVQINITSKERGTELDGYLKRRVLGQPATVKPEYQPYVKHLDRWLRGRSLAGAIANQQIYTEHYAGTLDVAFLDHGEYLVTELKTRGYPVGIDQFEEAKLQAVAYRLGLKHMGASVGGAAVVVVVTPYGLTELPLVGHELERIERLWNLRLNAYYGGEARRIEASIRQTSPGGRLNAP